MFRQKMTLEMDEKTKNNLLKLEING